MKIGYLFLSILLSTSISAQQFKGIQFDNSKSWEQVKEKAKADGKYIFVDVFATWCGPCKMMDQNVYQNDTVADLVKDKFISVKLQMDSSDQDNEYVKRWYETASDFGRKYKFHGYPSFLFFTPDGQLVSQDLGYKSVSGFIDMANEALDPEKAKLGRLMEDYQTGKKNYPMMGALAIYAKNVVKDKTLANKIAKEYMEKYLETRPEMELYSISTLGFVDQFSSLVKTDDHIFDVCYNHGSKIDSIMHLLGWADDIVKQAIVREKIVNKVAVDNKPLSKNPDWFGITQIIKRKYKRLDAYQLVLNVKIWYYRNVAVDWQLWADYTKEKVSKYPPKGDDKWNVFMTLNMPAWDAFLHCEQTAVLQMALSWSERSIQLEQPDPSVQYLDTRANLLYKLGRKEEALQQEEKAIEKCKEMEKAAGTTQNSFLGEFSANLEKMRQGERTW